MNEEVSQFIERMGLLWDADGFPRIAGRIFGLALLSPQPCSLDDIADTLGVSKASVSNDARLLEKLGFIERIGLPGDRRSYYQVTCDSMERTLSDRVARLRMVQETIESGLRLPGLDACVQSRLKSHDTAYCAVIKALETVVDELTDEPESTKTRSERA